MADNEFRAKNRPPTRDRTATSSIRASTGTKQPSRHANATRNEGRVPQGVQQHSPWEPSLLFWPLLACFTLSGMTGLVYQVLWGRMLTLVLGATTAATG